MSEKQKHKESYELYFPFPKTNPTCSKDFNDFYNRLFSASIEVS